MRESFMPASSASISFQDADLVEQVRDGDTAAFGHLVAKYQDRVYNTVLRINGNADDARDLTQDAFLRALESLDSFSGRAGFYTWLFRIAVNLTISYGRMMQRRKTVSLEPRTGSLGAGEWAVNRQGAGLVGELHSDEENPQAAASRTEVNILVVEALNELEDEHRTVLVLKDIESMDYAQIAEILDVPLGTVKSRVHRARMALRDKLRPLVVQT
jgi:RNA polymerase sigma-70 factor (ECF subfamily)